MRTIILGAAMTMAASTAHAQECAPERDVLGGFLGAIGDIFRADPADDLARRLHDAIEDRDVRRVNDALAGKSAAEIDALKRAYLERYGNTPEFELRNLPAGLATVMLRVPLERGIANADALIDLLNRPRAEAQADAILANRDRDTVYRILSTMGGPERELLGRVMAERGVSLDDVIAEVSAIPAPAHSATPGKKRLAMVVSEAGYHWEEVYGAYAEFRKAGYEVDLYTPTGAPPKPDSMSMLESKKGSQVGFGMVPSEGPESLYGNEIVNAFATVRPMSDMQTKDVDALFLPGGHGSHVDMNENPALHAKIEELHSQGKVLSAVCHATSTLGGAEENGRSILAGRDVTGFPAPVDERAVAAGMVLPEFQPPYDNDAALRAQGANLRRLDIFLATVNPNYTRVDTSRNPPVVTGMGPKAADDAAREVIKLLGR